MVIAETLAALGMGAKDLFLYNRQGFMFNKLQAQERDYHLQAMRIQQVRLYREDIKDLFTLTTKKMDQYLMLSTVGLMSTLAIFYNGRVPIDVPAWLFYLWAASCTSSLMFMLLASWFAVHGSVAAQIAMTRMRTTWLRLPVPRVEDITHGAAHVEDFERAKAASSLRVPLVEESPEELQARSDAAAEVDDDVTMFSDHFLLYQKIYARFQGYDAFARVALVIGTQQLLITTNYVSLLLYMQASLQIGTWALTVIVTAFSIANVYMNLLLPKYMMIGLATSLVIGMIFPGIATTQYMLYSSSSIGIYIGPLIISCHLISLGFMVYASYYHTQGGLPTLFTTVIQSDLLGFLNTRSKEGSLVEAIPVSFLVKRSISKALEKRSSELIDVNAFRKSKVSTFSRIIESDDVKLDLPDRGKIPDLVDHPLNDIPANSFYLICLTSLGLWFAGLVISIVTETSVSLTGWDMLPSNGILPSNGLYMG